MYKSFFKRFFDIVFSLLGLIIISPVFLLTWLCLVIANKGAGAFFIQERPGKNKRIFEVIKFKTMTDERDENGELLPNVVRLTKIGRIVRALSLDELPQFINILKGDMSFIGPRPLLTWFLPLYDATQVRRHEVRPGITGWAQVNGRNTLSYSKKFEYDVWYVDHLNMLLDLKIVWITVMNVLNRKDIGNGLQNEVDDLGWANKKQWAIDEFEKTYRN